MWQVHRTHPDRAKERPDTKDLRYRFNNRMIRGRASRAGWGAAFILPQVSLIQRPGKWIFI